MQTFGFPDLHRKGEKLQGRVQDRKAVAFLVEIIAPATDCLGKYKAGSNQIAEREKGYAASAAKDPCGNKPRNDTAVYCNTALPDFQDRDQIVPELRPRKSNIINPGADNAGRKKNQNKIKNGILFKIRSLFFTYRKKDSESARKSFWKGQRTFGNSFKKRKFMKEQNHYSDEKKTCQ